MPMNELTLLKELDTMSKDATGNNSTFIRENEYLLDRYEGNPYGDELPERSKVISNDNMDLVEADMPSLARIFLGAEEVVEFQPNNPSNEEDVAEADSKNLYVDWQIRKQPESFALLHGFIKNAEMQKVSVLKYFMEETTEVEEHKKTGLSDTELALFEESLKGENVKSVKKTVDVVREEENETNENTVVFKVEIKRKKVKFINIELEDFRMTRNARTKEDADLVGDVSLMKRGELMAMGFSREIVSSLELASKVEQNSRLPEIRDEVEGGPNEQPVLNNWASEEVEIENLYPLIDNDEDGILERRHIIRSRKVILKNEVFNHVPYAIMSAMLMPHKAIGKSRSELVSPTALVKTAILRGIQDNIYAVNAPRMATNENVNDDDMLVMRPNGQVRIDGKENPGQSIFPIVIPYVGDKALQVIQYWDQARAQTTGSLLASQGLDADELGQETATRFEGIKDASGAKVELVARVMAETGFRMLYEGVAWLDSNFQNAEVEKQVLGEELKVNPNDWKLTHHVVSKVGLGAGDKEQALQTMSALWVIHQQLKEANSPMTDEVKRFNILEKMTKASGLPEVETFFNNPEKPEELIKAQNEILTQMVQQLQEQVQAMQNPLAEAETIKQQGNLLKAQSDAHIDAANLREEQRQFNIETRQNQDQFNKELALKLTNLEEEFVKQLDAGFKQNQSVLEFNPETGELGAG